MSYWWINVSYPLVINVLLNLQYGIIFSKDFENDFMNWIFGLNIVNLKNLPKETDFTTQVKYSSVSSSLCSTFTYFVYAVVHFFIFLKNSTSILHYARFLINSATATGKNFSRVSQYEYRIERGQNT